MDGRGSSPLATSRRIASSNRRTSIGARPTSTGDGGNVKLWDPATGQLVRTLHVTGSVNGVNGVAFSPDGKLLASADSDGAVRF